MIPNFVSYRNTSYGSWFIQIFCYVISRSAWQCHLKDMLDEVSFLLRKTTAKENGKPLKQTCEFIDRMFYKKLYFNPGLTGEQDAELKETNSRQNWLTFEKYFGKEFKERFSLEKIKEHVLQNLIVHADLNRVHVVSQGPPNPAIFTNS